MNWVLFIVIVIVVAIIRAIYDNGSNARRTTGKNSYFIGTQDYQPYSNVYGNNRKQGPCAVKVTTDSEMSVVVIIRYNNIDGNVAGHLFIDKGSCGIICLPVGKFQTFFYSGRNWNPSKEMDCGLSGGFRNDEIFQEDPTPKNYTTGMMWTYTLRSVSDGNFTPVSTDKDLFF